MAALVGPQFRHLGFEAQPGEGERTPTLRSLAINLMGTVGDDAGVRAEAARRFDASPLGGGNGEPIPADVEAATLAVVAQLLRPGDYDALLERYRAASTPQEEMRSLNALSAFPDIDLALRTFDLAMTEVRSQNGWIVIAALLANPVAGQAIWGRITESWDAILERFPKNAHARIAEAIPALCGDAGFAGHGGAVPQASIPWRRDRAVSPSRWSAWASTSPSPAASAIAWPTAWGLPSPPPGRREPRRRMSHPARPAR